MADQNQPLERSNVPDQLTEALAFLSGMLLTEQTVEAVLHMLVTLAASAIGGIDEASVSLLRTGHFETTTTTSDEVAEADSVQYRTGKGPCVEASDGVVVNVGLERSRGRWPEFADTAIGKGFQGVLSTPLGVKDQKLGSLNLYSRSQDYFDEDEMKAAKAFADQASIVVANAAAFATSAMVNAQLAAALETRDIIGQAKGMLMVTEDCTADEAFDVLRRESQHSNRKLPGGGGRSGRAARSPLPPGPVNQVIEDARLLSGMSLFDLWVEYLALGGLAPMVGVESMLRGGASTGPRDHDLLAQALNDSFLEQGMDHPVPYFVPPL